MSDRKKKTTNYNDKNKVIEVIDLISSDEADEIDEGPCSSTDPRPTPTSRVVYLSSDDERPCSSTDPYRRRTNDYSDDERPTSSYSNASYSRPSLPTNRNLLKHSFSYVIGDQTDKKPDLKAVPKKSSLKQPAKVEEYPSSRESSPPSSPEVSKYPDGHGLPKNWVIYEVGQLTADFRRLWATKRMTKAQATARAKKGYLATERLTKQDFYAADSKSKTLSTKFARLKEKILKKKPVEKLDAGIELKKQSKNKKRARTYSTDDCRPGGKRARASDSEYDESSYDQSDADDPDYED
uniref:Uncharacterized protein n=1 Tax=Panagrellus redivivus TaxID=6233 RepID=A0A7E4VWE3_PANRE